MAKARASDPISRGANLRTQIYQSKASLPNEHDVDAQLFGDIAKSFGDKPRGAKALGAGFAKGLEYGSKSKGVAKRHEEADKYEQFMNYLVAANDRAIEIDQWKQKREMELEKIRPYAVGGLEISYSGMPYDQANERMRNLVDQVKINNPDIKGTYIGFIPNTPLVNMRNENGEDFVLSLSSLAGEDEVKRIQGNYIDQQKTNINQEYLKLEKEYAPVKYATQKERNENTQERNNIMKNQADKKLGETIGKKIDSSREFLTRAPEIKNLVKKHPDVFQSVIQSIWKEEKEPGFIKNFIKSVSNQWNEDKIAAFKVLEKDINKMVLDVANGFSRPNMFIEKIGSKAVPNLDMNAKGFLDALDTMIKENKTTLENNLQRMEILEQQDSKPLSQQYKKSAENALNGGEDDWSDIGTLAQ